ncbi:uncharacterized protein LOC130451945 [Diorhabda sublineata]|uniref:uncharacterized protein LOC130451945 n=1 Tax=Diorhabda sublineata TaxID=1163346 RepID=UPI0024E197FA|nr:uncharacterized protein LOC130451945 [Diorhabda sublineata]
MVADIEKMYRQVEIVEEQCDLQRIMWRSDPNLPLEVYTLNTVTYGTAPASFIAIRCLHQLALENSKKYPVASQVITRDFYVDDITGTDTIENAQILRQNITNILESGSFPLRKWNTNKPNIFNDINNISDLPDHYLSTDDQSKALGLVWNSQSDTLHISTDSIQIENNNFTKRGILSVIAQLFDSLGLVGPVIVKAKVIMQKLWQHKELPILATIKIPRQITVPKANVIEIHTFSDASTIAYGACSYLRTVDNSGQCSVRLICAKSRVSPLKVVTLPRLELNAALLATNLTAKLMEAFTCRISNIFYYTDSTIVLSWLNTEPALLKTFVANRVADMQRKSKIENWQHVKSEQNAADIISRGSLPSQLLECDMWWNGPFFLSNTNQPVTNNNFLPLNELPEVKNSALTHNVIIADSTIFERYSNFDKLNRVIAWILRFKGNTLRAKHDRIYGTKLTVHELKLTKQSIIRATQSVYFAEEIKCLIKNKLLNVHSKLLTLNPFMAVRGENCQFKLFI